MDLMKYGDDHSLVTVVSGEEGSPVVSWRKSGIVRAVLAVGNGTIVPLYDYDSAAAATNAPGARALVKGCGFGASAITVEAARQLLERELEALDGLVGRGAEIAGYIRRAAEGSDGATIPYHWYRFGPQEWLAAAEVGLAVEYLEGGGWRWCSPERAREVARVPLSLSEYREGLSAAIVALI
jgi:hypothetical protein